MTPNSETTDKIDSVQLLKMELDDYHRLLTDIDYLKAAPFVLTVSALQSYTEVFYRLMAVVNQDDEK